MNSRCGHRTLNGPTLHLLSALCAPFPVFLRSTSLCLPMPLNPTTLPHGWPWVARASTSGSTLYDLSGQVPMILWVHLTHTLCSHSKLLRQRAPWAQIRSLISDWRTDMGVNSPIGMGVKVGNRRGLNTFRDLRGADRECEWHIYCGEPARVNTRKTQEICHKEGLSATPLCSHGSQWKPLSHHQKYCD